MIHWGTNTDEQSNGYPIPSDQPPKIQVQAV